MLTTKYTKKALCLANERHFGQFDKQGMPYILHPIEVAQMCETEDEIVVALLHDLLEDTSTTEDELKQLFPQKIVEAVVALTRKDGEKYKEYIIRLSENELAKSVKLKDLENNTDKRRGNIPESLQKRYSWAKEYLNGK